MQLEVGKIYEGKVTGITKFGAFVELEPGTTGMVHISEVANTFVNEIKDHLTEGQQVKVKVLNITEEGKISLSIKKAVDNPPPRRDFKKQGGNGGNRSGFNGGNRNGGGNRGSKPSSGSGNSHSNNGGQPPMFAVDRSQNSGDASFEDMLSRFKQNSEEKMSDLKNIMDKKRRPGGTRRGGGNRG